MSRYDRKERRSFFAYFSIFILLILGIALGAYFSYLGFERQYRTQAEKQLSAVAKLKEEELVDWRQGQLANAELLHRNYAFSELVAEYFANPENDSARIKLQNWLDNYHIYDDYDQVRLLDIQGQTRLSHPEGAPPISDSVRGRIPEVLQSEQVIMVDFYRRDDNGEIRLALLIPIVDSETGETVIGLVAVSIDPAAYLYPFIQEWPVESSTTAETLIIRRDGEGALFLNQLRFDQNAAMNLRFPVSQKDLPSVMAVLGQTGEVEGIDYRGEAVLADVRPVPDSPWFLVTKMDETEIYEPLQKRTLEMLIFFGAMVLACAASLGMLWRQQRIRYYRSLAESAQALEESEAFTRAVMDNLPIGIAVNSVDPGVTFSYMNDAFPGLYRTTREALALPNAFWEVVYEDPVFREEIKNRILEDCATGDTQRMSWMDIPITRRGAETTFVSARNAPIPGKQLMISIVWDVTERKLAAENVRKMGQHYQALIENAPDGVVLLDGAGRFKFIGQSARRMFGYGASEEVSENPVEFTHPDDLPNVLTALNRLLEDPSYIPTLHYRYRDKSGNWKWIESTFRNLLAEPSVESIILNFRDITERKLAEDALQESENKYRALIENMQVGVVVHRPDTSILFSNPMASQVLGLTWEQMLGKKAIDPAWHFIKEDGMRCPLEEYPVNRALATRKPFSNLILGIIRPDRKEPIWVHCDAHQDWEINGNLRQVVITFFDITERKQAEMALRESEEKLRLLFEILPVGISVLDGEKRVVYSNPALDDLLNLNQQNMAEGQYRNRKYLRADGTEMPEEEFPSTLALTDQTAVWHNETGVAFNNGEVKWLDVSAVPAFFSDWKVVIVSNDITERKQAAEIVRGSEKRYRSLFESMLNGFAFCKMIFRDGQPQDFIYLEVNTAFEALTGLKDVVGKKVTEVIPGIRETDAELFEIYGRVALGGSPETFESYIEALKMWFSTSVYSPQHEYFVAVFDVVTERKLAEQKLLAYSEHLEEMVNERTRELREAQEQLMRQERLAVLGQLAGSMGHELRNPLGVISNAVYFLKLAQPDADEKVKEYLSIIENEARTSDKIITDLLDFSRSKVADRQQVSVSDVLQQTLKRFPAPPTVQVEFEIPSDLPPVFVDSMNLIQILGNLFVNAYQSLPVGLGRVEVTAVLQDDMVSIAVRDNGSGIPPENMAKLFEPLFTTKIKGIGLGLAVSRKLAEANGGRIEVQSEAGAGSVFTVWVPINGQGK